MSVILLKSVLSLTSMRVNRRKYVQYLITAVGEGRNCVIWLGLPIVGSGASFKKHTRWEKIQPVPIAILLATTSDEYFQAYRLSNALIYLQRNGVNLNSVWIRMTIGEWSVGVLCLSPCGSSLLGGVSTNLWLIQYHPLPSFGGSFAHSE